MIDKKRLALIIGGLVALIVVVATVTTLIVTGAQNQSQAPTPPVINTQAATENSPEPAVQLSVEQLLTIRKVGTAVGRFSSPEADEHRQARYIAAGMSETYAKEFEPLWKGLFTDSTGGGIHTKNMNNEPFSLEYEPGDAPGNGLFRAGFEVTHGGEYYIGSKTYLLEQNTTIWYFIFDEQTDKVIGIEQPSLADLKLPADVLKNLTDN